VQSDIGASAATPLRTRFVFEACKVVAKDVISLLREYEAENCAPAYPRILQANPAPPAATLMQFITVPASQPDAVTALDFSLFPLFVALFFHCSALFFLPAVFLKPAQGLAL
jgi:hypothetical protein